MRSIDISMPLFEGMPTFPGDPAFASEPVARLGQGGPFDVSRLTLASHAGTHLDPPSHFVAGGTPVDRVDLDTLNGPCRVVAGGRDGRSITPAEVERVPPGTSRLLWRTPNSARWARRLEFFDDYVGLELEAAARLLERGVRLVGIDALSVDLPRSETYPVHRLLLGRGVLILEGLLLGEAEPGAYHLGCLPLRLRGGDGAPARAVLTTG